MELKGLDFTIHELTPCMTPIQVSMIHEEQKKDATVQLLIQQLIQGWPNHRKEVDPTLNKYWALRDDISLEDDYHSKFPIFRLLPSISSMNMTSALESIIPEYGNVEEIICDNGKQLMAQEYKNFPVQYGFRLTTSNPIPPKRPWIYREAGTNHQEYPHQM